LVPSLTQMNSVHSFLFCFPKIHSNIILPSIPRSCSTQYKDWINRTVRCSSEHRKYWGMILDSSSRSNDRALNKWRYGCAANKTTSGRVILYLVLCSAKLFQLRLLYRIPRFNDSAWLRKDVVVTYCKLPSFEGFNTIAQRTIMLIHWLYRSWYIIFRGLTQNCVDNTARSGITTRETVVI